MQWSMPTGCLSVWALQRAKLMTAGSSCTISEQQFISVGNKKSRQAFARRDLSHGIVKRTD